MNDPISRPTVYDDPLPVCGLRPAPGTAYLLWCPEQGGWQTGE
jgi:hypothetical protein